MDPGTADRPYGLLAISQSPDGRPLYLGHRARAVRAARSAATWQKVTGVPFENLEVTDLLLMDAAPGRLYVTTPAGVFVYNTAGVASTATANSTGGLPGTKVARR